MKSGIMVNEFVSKEEFEAMLLKYLTKDDLEKMFDSAPFSTESFHMFIDWETENYYILNFVTGDMIGWHDLGSNNVCNRGYFLPVDYENFISEFKSEFDEFRSRNKSDEYLTALGC